MNVRECYNKVLKFEKADFIPNFDFGPMNPDKMLEQWQEEGMPADKGFGEYFGLHRREDMRYIDYDPIPGVPDQGIVEETDDHVQKRGRWGGIVEHKKHELGEGAKTHVRHGIETREDWDRIKEMFGPHPHRYPDHWDEDNWEQKKARWKDRDYVVVLWAPSMVGRIKEHMGFENYCLTLYTDRALVEEITETQTQLCLDIIGRALDEAQFDTLHFWEDIAFNNGPILSPELFGEIAVPRYKRITDYASSKGMDIFSVDSDGDITKLIPGWLKGGITHFWPMEVNAGVDVAALRKEYGKAFTMRGGYNKYALLKGKEEIEREFDRIEPVVSDGGYIPSLDHQVPVGVTFENICYYFEKKKILLGLKD